MPVSHLLYLHGFRSSPSSTKAQKVAHRLRERHPSVTWWCPQLPPSPAQAMAWVQHGVRDWPKAHMAVVGSSLGGFYARWVSLVTGCAKSVLLNPAVFPARDLLRYVGEQTAWHAPAESFVFHPGYVEELHRLEADIHRWSARRPLASHRDFAIVAQGDEVLSWQEMTAFCLGGTTTLLPGSDHALSDFDDHIGAVFDFLDLAR